MGSNQIAKQINKEKVLNPSSYNLLKRGKSIGRTPKDPTHWVGETVSRILERPEYAGHTVNFKSHKVSYRNKKIVKNPKEEWVIFENTHPAIVSQSDFDRVQELRKNKKRPQKNEKVHPLSGLVYCADCGLKSRCRYNCCCLNKQCTGSIGSISPFQCSYDQMIISAADSAAERLYKQGNTLFLKKQYREFYNLLEI